MSLLDALALARKFIRTWGLLSNVGVGASVALPRITTWIDGKEWEIGPTEAKRLQ